MEGRHNDTTIVKCHSCSWTGKAMDCIHAYKGVAWSEGDTEPVDQCPRCGGEDIFPLEEDLVAA